MKKFKHLNYLSLLFVSIVFFNSCENEPVENETLDMSSNNTIELKEFKTLIYKGEKYSKKDVATNEELINLVNNSEFYFKNEEYHGDILEVSDLYIYDDEESQTLHQRELDEKFKNEEAKAVRNRMMKNRAAVEFFFHYNFRFKFYRGVYFDYGNTRFVRKTFDQRHKNAASSWKFRYNGKDRGRLDIYDSSNQRGARLQTDFSRGGRNSSRNFSNRTNDRADSFRIKFRDFSE